MDDGGQATLHNQENNQFLLNAIKNKFAGNNVPDAAVSFSPPKFTIPLLKTVDPSNNSNTRITPADATSISGQQEAGTSSKLNQFILQQLNTKPTNGEIVNGGFALPKLKLGGGGGSGSLKPNPPQSAPKFVIPLLKNPSNIDVASNVAAQQNIATISYGIDNLRVNEEDGKAANQPVIDLTIALSSTNKASPSPHSRLLPRSKSNSLDVQTVATASPKMSLHFPITNEYCQTDVSNLHLTHSLAKPSPCGRIICQNYKYLYSPKTKTSNIRRYKNTTFKVKHKIQPFRFDTKSPDDIVSTAIKKYQRQHHT